MSAPDVEAQQGGSERSSCRRLDACLLGSMVALFALLVSGFTLGLMFARSVRTEMELLQPRDSPVREYAHGEPDTSYKAQNFAYLRAVTSELSNEVMDWESISYRNSQTVGSGYTYDSKHRALTVEREGSYFLYVNLNLTCLHKCTNGSFTVSFEDQHKTSHLSCTVHLQADHFEPVDKKCWNMIPQLKKNSRLVARIHSDTNLHGGAWRFEVNSSGFGMFLVDGLGTR